MDTQKKVTYNVEWFPDWMFGDRLLRTVCFFWIGVSQYFQDSHSIMSPPYDAIGKATLKLWPDVHLANKTAFERARRELKEMARKRKDSRLEMLIPKPSSIRRGARPPWVDDPSLIERLRPAGVMVPLPFKADDLRTVEVVEKVLARSDTLELVLRTAVAQDDPLLGKPTMELHMRLDDDGCWRCVWADEGAVRFYQVASVEELKGKTSHELKGTTSSRGYVDTVLVAILKNEHEPLTQRSWVQPAGHTEPTWFHNRWSRIDDRVLRGEFWRDETVLRRVVRLTTALDGSDRFGLGPLLAASLILVLMCHSHLTMIFHYMAHLS